VLERLLAVPAGGDGAVLKTLTAGEREILGLVADGLRNRAIAQRLFKSEKAVERHVGQIFCKLGLQPNGNGDIDRRVSAARMFLVQTGAVPGADARQR
jgi:DNA-binding NarL/FixJ family response regulator